MGDIAGKGRTELQDGIAVLKAKKAGDTKTIAEIQQRVNLEAKQQLELKLQQEQKAASMKRLLISNFFKGFLMLTPAFFFGTFDLFALSGFKQTVGGIQSYVQYKARSQAYKKGELSKPVGKIESFYQNLQEQTKKPAGINEGALHTIFREMQETGITNEPATDISILFNPNPIQSRRIEIFSKFQEIVSAQNIYEKFQHQKEEKTMLDEEQIYRPPIHRTEISFANELISFADALERYLYNEFWSLEDRQPQQPPDKKIYRIPFPVDLLRDAINMLSSTCYEGSTIIVEQEQTIAINDEVSSKIINKIASGLQISKLERIIMDVAILTAGGYQIDGKVNSGFDFNENSFEKMEENQERIKVFTVLGKSMFDVIKPNTDVLVREMDADYQYKVGEIVVAKNKNGIKFIHRIEKILLINNKQFMVTKGTNNQYFDEGFITEDNIIGVADLSHEAFAEVQERIMQGSIERDIAFGLIEKGNLNDIIPNNAKGKLLRLIIENMVKCFPEGYIQPKDISLILFGEENGLDTFFNRENLKLMPTPHFLDEMQNRIQEFFNQRKDFIISKKESDILKENILSGIQDFKSGRSDIYVDLSPSDISGHEIVTRLYFEYLFGKTFHTYKAGTLSWIDLDLDGYNSELGVAFELHGPQHYEWEWWLGKKHNGKKVETETEAKAALKDQQDKDARRRDICKDNKVILIEVPYYFSELADFEPYHNVDYFQDRIIKLFSEQGNAIKFGLYNKYLIEKWIMVSLIRQNYLHFPTI